MQFSSDADLVGHFSVGVEDKDQSDNGADQSSYIREVGIYLVKGTRVHCGLRYLGKNYLCIGLVT